MSIQAKLEQLEDLIKATDDAQRIEAIRREQRLLYLQEEMAVATAAIDKRIAKGLFCVPDDLTDRMLAFHERWYEPLVRTAGADRGRTAGHRLPAGEGDAGHFGTAFVFRTW